MLDAADRATSALAERVRWAALVGELTRRNRGRRTIIESDDPGLGAQSQEYNYPFIGAVYDERNDHLKLMLGDGRSAFCQVSRNIDDVRVLDVLTDDAGRDRALRVEHGAAQTLMTFAE
jgi:phosphatidylserine/phosphatidylglycerophosphate/cardiolipin synthase-like enzyme